MKQTNYANPFVRLLAALTDQLIGIAIFLLIIGPIFSTTILSQVLGGMLEAIVFLIYIGIFMPLLYSLMTSRLGGTPGQLVTGIRVESEQGGLVSFKRALFRTYIGGAVGSLFLGAGYIYTFIDEKRRGWHDLVAGTVVLTSNPAGIFIGILALFGLLVMNFVMVKNAVSRIISNRESYSQIFKDIRDEYNLNNDIRDLENQLNNETYEGWEEPVGPLGWTTFSGTNYPYSFSYPDELVVSDYSDESSEEVSIIVDKEDGVLENWPIITITSEPLNVEPLEYFMTQYKGSCPTGSNLCNPPVTGPRTDFYQFESVNSHYPSISTYVTNSAKDIVFAIEMGAREGNKQFTSEEKEIYKEIVNSFKFVSF